MREGSDFRARGSAGCRAGLPWKRERHRAAQREGPGSAYGAGGHKVKLREGSESRMCLGTGVEYSQLFRVRQQLSLPAWHRAMLSNAACNMLKLIIHSLVLSQ
jgi:hypothetical protein